MDVVLSMGNFFGEGQIDVFGNIVGERVGKYVYLVFFKRIFYIQCDIYGFYFCLVFSIICVGFFIIDVIL